MELTLPPSCVLFAQTGFSMSSSSVPALLLVAGAAPTITVSPRPSGSLLIAPRSCGTRLLEQCGAFFCFSVLAVLVIAASLRLAGVMGRLSRSEWSQWGRNTIVHLVVPLVGAGEVLIVGGEPLSASGFLSDGVSAVRCQIRTKILSLMLIIVSH